MPKLNYIARMDDRTRKLAIWLLVPATLVCAAGLVFAIATAILLLPNEPDAPVGTIIGCNLVFGFLFIATGWMAIRLIRQERAANGVTVMPESFIQIFGFVFLFSIVAVAVINRNIWLIGEGVGIALAMIGIRSLIRRELSEQNAN